MAKLGNSSTDGGSTSGGGENECITCKPRQARLTKRLAGLKPGRYMIMLTVGNEDDELDWTVVGPGKVER